MSNKKINYLARDFQGIKSELIKFSKEYYPELFSSKFDKLDAVTTSRLMEVDNYINNAIYKDCGLRQKLFPSKGKISHWIFEYFNKFWIFFSVLF